MKKKILKTLVATCMTAMMFVGCASNSATNEDKAIGKTVTVTDVRGEVEIPADPQRIVDLSGNSDILSILGPPGYPKPIALATLSKASPAASSLVFPKILYFP